MHADGGAPVLLTDKARDLQPAWSPDGGLIAFSRDLRHIFVVEIASGDLTQLTETIDSYAPSWSPDGSAIVFGTNRAGTQDLWIMDSAGRGESPLTQDRAVDLVPTWRPT